MQSIDTLTSNTAITSRVSPPDVRTPILSQTQLNCLSKILALKVHEIEIHRFVSYIVEKHPDCRVEIVGGAARKVFLSDREWVKKEAELSHSHELSDGDLRDIDIRIHGKNYLLMRQSILEFLIKEKETGCDYLSANRCMLAPVNIAGNDVFAVATLGKKEVLGLDLVFVDKLSRDFLFEHDNFAINLIGIPSIVRCSKQGLADLVKKKIHIPNPECVNRMAWPTLISYLTRGFTLEDYRAERTLRERHEQECADTKFSLDKVYINHHLKNPLHKFVLYFNACTLLDAKSEALFWELEIDSKHPLIQLFHQFKKHKATLRNFSNFLFLWLASCPQFDVTFSRHLGDEWLEAKIDGASIFIPANVKKILEELSRPSSWKLGSFTLPENLNPSIFPLIFQRNPLICQQLVRDLKNIQGLHPVAKSLAAIALKFAPPPQVLSLMELESKATWNSQDFQQAEQALLALKDTSIDTNILDQILNKFLEEKRFKQLYALLKKRPFPKLEEKLKPALDACLKSPSLLQDFFPIWFHYGKNLPDFLPGLLLIIKALSDPRVQLSNGSTDLLQQAFPLILDDYSTSKRFDEAWDLIVAFDALKICQKTNIDWIIPWAIEQKKSPSTLYLLLLKRTLSTANMISLIRVLLAQKMTTEALVWIQKLPDHEVLLFIDDPLFAKAAFKTGIKLVLAKTDSLTPSTLFLWYKEALEKEPGVAMSLFSTLVQKQGSAFDAEGEAKTLHRTLPPQDALRVLDAHLHHQPEEWSFHFERLINSKDFEECFSYLQNNLAHYRDTLFWVHWNRTLISGLIKTQSPLLISLGNAPQVVIPFLDSPDLKKKYFIAMCQKGRLPENILDPFFLLFGELSEQDKVEVEPFFFPQLAEGPPQQWLLGTWRLLRNQSTIEKHSLAFINTSGKLSKEFQQQFFRYLAEVSLLPDNVLIPLLEKLLEFGEFHLFFDRIAKAQHIKFSDAKARQFAASIKEKIHTFDPELQKKAHQFAKLKTKGWEVIVEELLKLSLQGLESVEGGKLLQALDDIISLYEDFFGLKYEPARFSQFIHLVNSLLLTHDRPLDFLKITTQLLNVCSQKTGIQVVTRKEMVSSALAITFRCRMQSPAEKSAPTPPRKNYLLALEHLLSELVKHESAAKHPDYILNILFSQLKFLIEDFPSEQATIQKFLNIFLFYPEAFSEALFKPHLERINMLHAHAEKDKFMFHFSTKFPETAYHLHLFSNRAGSLKIVRKEAAWHEKEILNFIALILSSNGPLRFQAALITLQSLKKTVFNKSPLTLLSLYNLLADEINVCSNLTLPRLNACFIDLMKSILQTNDPECTLATFAGSPTTHHLVIYCFTSALAGLERAQILSPEAEELLVSVLISLAISYERKGLSIFDHQFFTMLYCFVSKTAEFLNKANSEKLIELTFNALLLKGTALAEEAVNRRASSFSLWILSLAEHPLPSIRNSVDDLIKQALDAGVFINSGSAFVDLMHRLHGQ